MTVLWSGQPADSWDELELVDDYDPELDLLDDLDAWDEVLSAAGAGPAHATTR